jgi:hypothetical protein
MKIKDFIKEQRKLGGPWWFLGVLWRSVWIVPAYVVIVLHVTIIFVGWGHVAANNTWKNSI